MNGFVRRCLAHRRLPLALAALAMLALSVQGCVPQGATTSFTSTPGGTLGPAVGQPPKPAPPVEPTPVAPLAPPTALPSAASPVAAPSSADVPTISVEDVKRNLDGGSDLILIDVRDEAAFAISHIRTAISMPLEELPGRLAEIKQGPEVIVYAECT